MTNQKKDHERGEKEVAAWATYKDAENALKDVMAAAAAEHKAKYAIKDAENALITARSDYWKATEDAIDACNKADGWNTVE